MKEREELNLILQLIGKYNLPLSPILEYAIKEKMEEYPLAVDNEQTEEAEGDDSNVVQIDIVEDKPVSIQQEKDEVRDEENFFDFRIEHVGNHCYIINSHDEKVFSSSGKLKIIDGEYYRISYSYSSFAINLVLKKESDAFELGKRIIRVGYRTPLYSSLERKNYLDQIEAIRYDEKEEGYQVKISNKWYNNIGRCVASVATKVQPKNNIEEHFLDVPQANASSNVLKVVEYSSRSIAVIGDTKPHREVLRETGGFYMNRTKLGPAWLFPIRKRKEIQAYVDRESSAASSWDSRDQNDSSRQIIQVTYPDGRIFCSNLVWETLVDVVKYAGPEKVRELNIICMGDNLISPYPNENPIYRAAQKDLGNGLYVCTYSSTDVKYKQIEKINQECQLNLVVVKIPIDNKGKRLAKENEVKIGEALKKDKQERNPNVSETDGLIKDDKDNRLDISSGQVTEDRRIGYEIRLFPSQKRGKIINVRLDDKGFKKIVVKTLDGKIIEIDDLPYIYELLKHK